MCTGLFTDPRTPQTTASPSEGHALQVLGVHHGEKSLSVPLLSDARAKQGWKKNVLSEVVLHKMFLYVLMMTFCTSMSSKGLHGD